MKRQRDLLLMAALVAVAGVCLLIEILARFVFGGGS